MASAILLARQGFSVTLYEKNDHVGGRASLLQKDGFTRDMGPSWYLMPDVFKQFFADIGEDVEDHLDLTKLDPSYKIFFTDKQAPGQVEIHADPDKDIETLERIEPGVRSRFFRYLAKAQYQYEVGMKFVRKNYDSVFDFMTPELAWKGLKLNVFTTFTRYVARFFRHPWLQKIMMYPLVFLGTDPAKAPALYNIMSHVDFNMGVFYPQGGIYAIVKALVAISQKYDITIMTSAPVTQLVVDAGVIQGVRYLKDDKKQTDMADIVVVNADMAWAETTLLPVEYQTYNKSYRDKKEYAPSAFIVYLGIDKKLPHIQHHTLLFSEDRKQNFDEIFRHKTLPGDPSLYMCVPSKTDPSVAPQGKENMFILVPIPC